MPLKQTTLYTSKGFNYKNKEGKRGFFFLLK